MKIGSIYITRRKTAKEIHESQLIKNWLRSVEGRELVSRMARSEVKNYLAEIAEEAEMPFVSAATWLRGIQLQIGVLTNLRDDDDNMPENDAPFSVFDVIEIREDQERLIGTGDPWFAGPDTTDEELIDYVIDGTEPARANASAEARADGHTDTCTCPDKADNYEAAHVVRGDN
jgi:hypothetical protein